MTFEAFSATATDSTVNEAPEGISAALTALWWDRRGEWDRAHQAAQGDEGREGAWVHAYLHRKEGDVGNASYWYRRAGRPVQSGDLEAEWEGMVRALLG